MRATRAFVGAFGAGISLMIAASVALLLVSSVFAFRGWPDDLAGSSSPEVTRLSDAAEPARAEAKATAAVALPAAPAARKRTSTRAARVERVERRQVAGAVDEAVAPAGSPAPTAAPQQQSSTPPSGASDTPAKSEPLGPAKPVADVVKPVAPPVGTALESVGAAGAETVDKVGQTVDGAVKTLLP